MADIMLDLIYEVVKNALERSNLMPETKLVKHYADFCITLKLENWTNLELEEGNISSFSNHSHFFSNEDTDNIIGENSECDSVEVAPLGSIKVENESTDFKVEDHGSYEANPQEGSTPFVKAEAVEKVYKIVSKRNRKVKNPTLYLQEGSTPSVQAEEISKIVSKKPRKMKNPTRRVNEKITCSLQKGHLLSGASRGVKSKVGKKVKSVFSKSVIKSIQKRYQCEHCEYRTDCKRRLRLHTSTHSSEKPIACTLCEFRCKREDSLKNHMRRHTGEKPYKCDSCDFETNSHGNLWTHKKIKHSDVKNYSCKYCDYSAKLASSIKSHEKLIHLTTSQLYKCQQCSFKSMNEKRYLMHVQAHELNTSFICSICGAKFIDRSEFDYHLRTHNAVPKKKNISCPECDLKFKTRPRMRSHLFVHTGVKDFKCRLCSLEFRIYGCMQKHHRRKHPDEFIFCCKPCEFYTNDLKEHKRHPTTLIHLANHTNE